jgi:hypothetical protein
MYNKWFKLSSSSSSSDSYIIFLTFLSLFGCGCGVGCCIGCGIGCGGACFATYSSYFLLISSLSTVFNNFFFNVISFCFCLASNAFNLIWSKCCLRSGDIGFLVLVGLIACLIS